MNELLNFISKKFKKGNIKIQLTNYRNLLNYVVLNNLSFSEKEISNLVVKSSKLFNMISVKIKHTIC